MAARNMPVDGDLLRVRAGETVFREGERGDALYVVLAGKVELRVRGRLVETVGPGGILGEMALIEEAPRGASARAKADSDLVPISEARFMEMVQKTPSFALQIMKVMAARLRRMNSRLGRRPTSARPRARTRRGR